MNIAGYHEIQECLADNGVEAVVSTVPTNGKNLEYLSIAVPAKVDPATVLNVLRENGYMGATHYSYTPEGPKPRLEWMGTKDIYLMFKDTSQAHLMPRQRSRSVH